MDNFLEIDHFTLDEIRKEALEHIVIINNEIDVITQSDENNAYRAIKISQFIAKIDWIKMFFNINEDDLK